MQFIKEKRVEGKLNQEIYAELSNQYFDKKSIALLIKGTPTLENLKKYKAYNFILIGLLGITALLKALTVFNMVMGEGPVWELLLIFIVPVLNFYFIYEIARFNPTVYRSCGALTILGFVQSIGKFDSNADAFISFALCAAIAGLSYFLYYNLFPNYQPKSLEKDSEGEYILAE